MRTLPKVLKYLPSDKAQDARNYVNSLQYWLGGNDGALGGCWCARVEGVWAACRWAVAAGRLVAPGETRPQACWLLGGALGERYGGAPRSYLGADIAQPCATTTPTE